MWSGLRIKSATISRSRRILYVTESGFYNTAYGNFESPTYRQVRIDTYGKDLGQTSWVTTEESEEIPRLLDLRLNSSALELGCGSGGYALHLAEKVGCCLVGLDINASGVGTRTNLRWPEVSLHRPVSSSVMFRTDSPSMTTLLMPYSRMTFCAIFQIGPRCWVRCFAY